MKKMLIVALLASMFAACGGKKNAPAKPDDKAMGSGAGSGEAGSGSGEAGSGSAM